MTEEPSYNTKDCYRPATLQHLFTLLQRHQRETIVIQGASGMGKTYIARKAIEEVQHKKGSTLWFQAAHANRIVESGRLEKLVRLTKRDTLPFDLIVIDDVLPGDIEFYRMLCASQTFSLLITCRSYHPISPDDETIQRIFLEPLGAVELRTILHADTPAATLLDYMLATGGVPSFMAGTVHVADIENHLRYQFREITLYQSILYALAEGANRISEIADYCGETRTKLLPYLNRLIAHGWVEKTEPFESAFKTIDQTISAKNSTSDSVDTRSRPRRGRYFITNCGLFNLYEGVQHNRYLARIAQDWLHVYFSAQDRIIETGAWWDTHPTNGQRILIDIVGCNADQTHFIFADCLWDDEFDELKALKAVAHKAGLFFRVSGVAHDTVEQIHYFLFVKHPLSDDAQAYAHRMHIMKLITAEELLASLT